MQLFFFLNEYSRCSFWEVSLEMFCIVVINKQKYCLARKNWIAMKAKIVLSLLYHFWEKNTGIESIYKTRKKSTKSHVDSCYLSREVSIQKQPPDCSAKKSVLKNFTNSTGKHLCLESPLTEAATGGVL